MLYSNKTHFIIKEILEFFSKVCTTLNDNYKKKPTKDLKSTETQ